MRELREEIRKLDGEQRSWELRKPCRVCGEVLLVTINEVFDYHYEGKADALLCEKEDCQLAGKTLFYLEKLPE